MWVYHDLFLLPGSGSTFPEVDPDPAKWYGSTGDWFLMFVFLTWEGLERHGCSIKIVLIGFLFKITKFHLINHIEKKKLTSREIIGNIFFILFCI